MAQNAGVKPKSASGRFYGVVVNQWRVGNLSFSESVYPPWTNLKRHLHQHSYFSILLRGSYRESYGGGVRECVPASAVLHPPGEEHADRFLHLGGHIFRFEIVDGDSDLFLADRIWDANEVSNGRIRCLAARLYRESRTPDRFSPLAAEALAMEIISEASRDTEGFGKKATPNWLARATDLLRDTLPDHLTIKRLASAVGVHPVHLARVFRRHYGCSVGEYARNWRVETASRRLANSASPIAEIALHCGFADQSHLCRSFKAVGGLTPREFRAIFGHN